ncbi:DUF502 domain-containing protein, partial [Candidatus Calescamantes bacterium]|nr:DUF502 domain-containing protein [Candidatus Calescamantes bacterium]
MKKLNSIFLAGLFVVVPISITLWVFFQIVSLGDKLIRPIMNLLNRQYGWPIIPGVGLVVIILLIFIIGVIAKNFLGKKLFLLMEWIIDRVPIVNKIYQSIKDISNAFLGTSEMKLFKKVVLIDYPSKGIKSIGFMTNETTMLDEKDNDYVSVFIPTTPNPTSGFFLMYRKEDVKEMDLKVDEALKLII